MTSAPSPSASPSSSPSPAPADGPAIRTFALQVEYDGRGFAGWQAQGGLPTIAGALAEACRRLTGAAPRRLGCAGRTDSGVHARCQLADLELASAHAGDLVARAWAAPPRLPRALNRFLPPAVRVHRAWRAPPSFRARRAAAGKVYRYQIYVGPAAVALVAGGAWHLRRALDLVAMRAAAAQLVGAHDFAAFRHAHCQAAHARRHLWRVAVAARPRPPAGTLVTISIGGNAFCRHMCRIIVGTLVAVGQGALRPEAVGEILLGRDRRRAGPTAPAEGLVLWRILLAPRARRALAAQAAATGVGASPALVRA